MEWYTQYSLYLGLMPRPYKRLVKNNNSFSVNLKRKKSTSSSSDEDKEVKPPSASDPATAGLSNGCHEDDIGKFIGLATTMPVDKKKHLLENGWVPSKNYDFVADAKHLKRKFNHQWLET